MEAAYLEFTWCPEQSGEEHITVLSFLFGMQARSEATAHAESARIEAESAVDQARLKAQVPLGVDDLILECTRTGE